MTHNGYNNNNNVLIIYKRTTIKNLKKPTKLQTVVKYIFKADKQSYAIFYYNSSISY